MKTHIDTTPLVRLLLACGLFLVAACPLSADPIPKELEAWAKWVERQFPISDDQGHGPDIGGAEWMQALDRRLGISDAQGHGPDHGSEEWRQAVQKKLQTKMEKQPAEDARELLSAHETEAAFVGIKEHRCMGRTSLCPDRCGHSGSLAVFTITKYLRYEMPGEYGDPKQETFQILIQDNLGQVKVAMAIHEKILALKPGAAVRLDWNHDYVTRDRSKSPERVIVRLGPLATGP